MLKKIWQKIRQWIWKHKFVICSVLFFCLTIHYGAGYYSQKKETMTYKAKYEAVSALFKPTAAACPRFQLKSSSQAQPATRPAVPPPAPISRRGSAPRQMEPPDNDALSEAVRAAEKAKAEALKEDEPFSGQSVQTNPAINRRDKNGRLKLPPSGVRVIRIPKWAE